jgi:hypothetical protein
MRMGVGQAVFLRPKKFDGKGGILYVSVAKGRCGPFFFCTPVSKLPPLCQASTNKRIYYLGFTMTKRDIA